MAYLYFERFVVSMKGTAKRLEELSVHMTVRKLIIRLLAKTLAAASDYKSCLSHCSMCSSFPTGGAVRGATDLRCTWATVMAHFFASSSLASSLG